jgi:hypothetical protein
MEPYVFCAHAPKSLCARVRVRMISVLAICTEARVCKMLINDHKTEVVGIKYEFGLICPLIQ